MKTIPPKFCALCLAEITSKNNSKEHIVSSSIGGRLTVQSFICKSCNEQSGDDWDAVLAAQFNWFSITVGIKRQSGRGKPPRQLIETVNGKRLLLHADGKMTPEHPVYEKVENGNQTKISIQARTLEEAKDILKKIAKKYPKLDKDKVLQEAKSTEAPLDSLIKMNLDYGGPFFGRSLVKTALAFSSKENIPHELCDKAINYLKNLVDESKAPYGFFYLRDLVRNRPADKLFHCVAVLGDPQKRRLIAYVEYFGLARFIVNLSSDYSGERIKSIYALDPTSGLQIDINVDLDLTDTELQLVLKDDAIPYGEYMKAVDYALAIAIGQSFEKHKNKAIENAFIYAFEGLGVKPGGFVAVKDSHKFSQLFIEKLTPFLVSNMKQNGELVKLRQGATTKEEKY